MKAFGYDHNGGPDVFEEYDIPTPEIAANQILIETQAFGLNNFERASRAGEMRTTTHQIIPGRDVAGIVAKVGNEVTDLKAGDRVVAHGHHAYSEYAVGENTNTVKIPDEVSFSQAAGIVTPGITAYNAVHLFGEVKSGQTVVVKGASGGVGSLSAQLAVAAGATVIGIGSSRNADYVNSLGVQQFVAYDKENPAEVLADKADVVINSAMNGVGSESDVQIVKSGGTIASVAHDEPQTNKDIRFNHIFPTEDIPDTEALSALLKGLADKKLAIKIGYELPFTLVGVTKGHQLLEEPHDGRVIISKDA